MDTSQTTVTVPTQSTGDGSSLPVTAAETSGWPIATASISVVILVGFVFFIFRHRMRSWSIRFLGLGASGSSADTAIIDIESVGKVSVDDSTGGTVDIRNAKNVDSINVRRSDPK